MRIKFLSFVTIVSIVMMIGSYVPIFIATGFDYPVGAPDGTGYNTNLGCLWLQTTKTCGPLHPGLDFNENGNYYADQDFDNPVYAVANGFVVYSDYAEGYYWGNIIMIEHFLPDGTKVWSQYGHINRRYVRSGSFVHKGQLIGTMGKGYMSRFYTHLHFEIRIKEFPAGSWTNGWTKDKILSYYVNPVEFIDSHRKISYSFSKKIKKYIGSLIWRSNEEK
jgi:murein DD-endopeptidase MepM/ murein hydrolase activator NlpD